MTHLTSLSASQLARLVTEKRVSSLEIVDAHIERAEQLRALNALSFSSFDRARCEARERDAQLARGERLGSLHGMPFTVKDWLEAEGLPCLAGDEVRRGMVCQQDATAVARLRAAGGIVLGKTAVLPDTAVYGRVANPHGQGRSPGGSSSGEAALIAAGGSPLGLGSDSGGSIRQPAAFCGVAGLKPTSGRVPLTGHLPRINPLADPRTVIGPLARRVEDLALALHLIAGEDGRDASVVPAPLGDYREVRVPVLRAVFFDRLPGGEALGDADASRVLWEAVRALEHLGVEVREAAPPGLDATMSLTQAYWARPESSSWELWEPDGVSTLSADQVERHLFEWDRFRRGVLGFMRDVDVILTPVTRSGAVRHGDDEGGIDFTAPFSLTGQPAAVVRCGETADGRPLGVQVVARMWREDVALAVAHALEEALGGYRVPPSHKTADQEA
ncbi:amidase [Deinococcus sp. Arct2-2]|uniref:amidase n=1 Tax=Deinococcus sp. Arct2-2 TaxID=2568653 RepID=UPI0010A2C232|nr:amidase [Deinococcus sp. Arct2-2]THF68161.1 amidase [Deinococcus sp. Arct2-2]